MEQLPETRFLRLPQIIGNPKAKAIPLPPQSPPLKACLVYWRQRWCYPKPVKLWQQITTWYATDIAKIIASAGAA